MRKRSMNKTDKELEQQLQMYKTQLDIVEDMNASYRTFCHDMKHHMSLLADYIQNNENQRALEYLEKMNYRMKECSRYVNTGNCGIDSILNRKMKEVKEKGGKVITDIKIKEELPVDDFDMNIILGNLLSNACEAIERCEKKEIEIAMQYDRGVLKIKIANSYNGALKERDGLPVSTKKDEKEHGIGLLSVRRAVKRYHGDFSITHNENEFCAVVLLYT